MTALATPPARISLDDWDRHYDSLVAAGLREPSYGGPLRRHVAAGDHRLLRLAFDNSAAALRLWNLVLSETQRLFAAKAAGRVIIGAMKDLGTVPLLAYAAPNAIAFYPDGTWWIPCIMENSTCDLAHAQRLGIGDSFCPVRAMLGAFISNQHFPPPDLLACSVGATCDDFSAIAQRLASTGRDILWWEIPALRLAEPGEAATELPDGRKIPRALVTFVASELQRVRDAIAQTAGFPLTDVMLADSIHVANRARGLLAEIRDLAFSAAHCPMPALEVLLAEMLALHFCSDREEALATLADLRDETARRAAAGLGVLSPHAARIFWVNPVADLRVMNLLEDVGGRLVGADFMFCHALDPIPEHLPPIEALAHMALSDPMIGSAAARAARICQDAVRWHAEAVVVSRIPGASHCGLEGRVIIDTVQHQLGLPVLELEVPPLSDALRSSLRTRLEALVEVVRGRRR